MKPIIQRFTHTAILIAGTLAPGHAQMLVQRFEPVNFSQVTITDSFWKPKMDKVATATLQACIVQTEDKTGRIRNFEKVAANEAGNRAIPPTRAFITTTATFIKPLKR